MIIFPAIMIGLFFILLGLTGWLTTTWLIRLSDQPPDLGWPEWLFISLSLGVILIGWLAFILVELGCFSLPTLLTAAAVYTIGLGLWLRRQKAAWYLPQSQAGTSPEALGLAILIVVAGFLFARPTEYVFGGADAGVYANLGAHIAHTGQLLTTDEELAKIPAALQPGLFREQEPGIKTQYLYLPGFYLDDTSPGLIIPQFFALYPTWLAIATSLFGLWGGLYTNTIWAILGLLALYWAGREWFGFRVAALAAFLLLLTPAQIFFARYPTTEALTQFLTWSGFYGLICLVKERKGNILWAVIAGLGVGQAALVRIDIMPLLAIILAWLGSEWLLGRWQRAHLWFAGCWLLTTAHALFHALTFAWPYTFNTYGGVFLVLQSLLGILPLVGMGLVVLILLALLKYFRRNLQWPGWGRHALSFSMIGLVLYAYFVRPRLGETIVAPYWYGGGAVPISDHLNMVRLGWYISPLGIGLATLGGALIIERERWRYLWPIAVIGLVYSIFYIARFSINPHHLYAARRYVPVIIPIFLIAAAYGLDWLANRHGWPAKVVAGLLCLALGGWISYNDRVLLGQTDYKGAIHQVETIANALPKRSVLLFNDATPVGVGVTVGTPLYYLYDYLVFDLQENRLDMKQLNMQLTTWWAEGRPVFLILGEKAVPLEGLTGDLNFISDDRIETPVLEASYDHFPSQIYSYNIPLSFYQITPPAQTSSTATFSRVNIGRPN